MFRQVLPIILVIHILCAGLYSIFILIKRSHLRKEHIIPIFLVPVFGILAAITVEVITRKMRKEDYPIDLYSFKLDADPYWKTIFQRKEEKDILPLEEAVILNDNKTRRKLMLETLFDDPYKYLDVLMISKNNDDIETAHYATTTISKIQREFQMGIQKMAITVENDPTNVELLDDYLVLMEKYIQSGVLEDYLLQRQRVLYSKELDRKLALIPNDKPTLIKKINNCLALKEFDSARMHCETLKNAYPYDEDTWIEAVRVCVDSKDKKHLEEVVRVIRNNGITWSKTGREQLAPWLSG